MFRFRHPGSQIGLVVTIELILVSIAAYFAYGFWQEYCSPGFISCLSQQELSLGSFFFLSVIRPFVFTPVIAVAMIAGHTYGPIGGTIATAIGATISAIPLFYLSKLLGTKLIVPWLKANLPNTLKLLHDHDWKIVLISRLVPFLSFDILTLGFGLANFRWRAVILASFIGILPELYIFAELADRNSTVLSSSFTAAWITVIFFVIPWLIIEYRSRKKGGSLIRLFQAMVKEIHQEILSNNEINKRHAHDPNKIPVLLLYGFFSSRRSLTTLERVLNRRGYEVISFNLGGLLGVFFTRSITETAQFIDYKLRRQFEKHNLNQIHIVAHSKGGLVASWWLLKMGGADKCKKLITMGTPFKGSSLTWLAIITPLGFIFRDLWQMRPKSELLRELHNAPIPEDVKIYNFFSNRDRVARGADGIFVSNQNYEQVVPIPMHHIQHFDFLTRRDIGDSIVQILGSPYRKNKSTDQFSD